MLSCEDFGSLFLSMSFNFTCLVINLLCYSTTSRTCRCTIRLIRSFSYIFIGITSYSMSCFIDFFSNKVITGYRKFTRQNDKRSMKYTYASAAFSFTVPTKLFPSLSLPVTKLNLIIKILRIDEQKQKKNLRFVGFFFNGFNESFRFRFSTLCV